MKEVIGMIATLMIVAVTVVGCSGVNSEERAKKAEAKQTAEEALPDRLEVASKELSFGSWNSYLYIMRDKETGQEYIIVMTSKGVAISEMTQR